MSLAVKIKESETLKTQIKSKRVNFSLSPINNEELTVVSTFLSTFDVVTDTITITLPVNTQDSVLLTLTENIGKSTHEVKDIRLIPFKINTSKFQDEIVRNTCV